MSDESSHTANPQTVDAIALTDVLVVGQASAMAMGSLYQTMGNSTAMAASNAVFAQQQANILFQANTALCVKLLLGDG